MGGVRALGLAFLLCACVTAANVTDVPAALRGCWIERSGINAKTFRWFPKAEGSSWHGDEMVVHDGDDPGHQGFDIDATGGEENASGWTICPLDDGLPHGPPCMPLWFGAGHAVGDDQDWMEIHVTPTLTVASHTGAGLDHVCMPSKINHSLPALTPVRTYSEMKLV